MRGFFSKFFNSFVEWLFRPRSVGLALVRSGLGMLALVFAFGFVFDFSWPLENGRIDLKLDTSNGTPQLIAYGVATVALVLIALGTFLEFQRFRRLQRKRTIAIELRGLRDGHGIPLADAIPGRIEGNREQLLLDIRQLDDGQITSPQHAMDRILQLPSELRSRIDGADRDDITLVYGGLAAVPFTFLTGVLLDDETRLEVMDWDRVQAAWRTLEDPDDGQRFEVTGLSDLADAESTVAVAISASYDVDVMGVSTRLPSVPIIGLKLQGRSNKSHWSGAKQAALCDQFLNTLIELSGRGVGIIHLFIAAPSSLVLNLGRAYDKRNLPTVIVHQYERSQAQPYPWGIAMPVAGTAASLVVA